MWAGQQWHTVGRQEFLRQSPVLPSPSRGKPRWGSRRSQGLGQQQSHCFPPAEATTTATTCPLRPPQGPGAWHPQAFQRHTTASAKAFSVTSSFCGESEEWLKTFPEAVISSEGQRSSLKSREAPGELREDGDGQQLVGR